MSCTAILTWFIKPSNISIVYQGRAGQGFIEGALAKGISRVGQGLIEGGPVKGISRAGRPRAY
jgi:hypothetical protein